MSIDATATRISGRTHTDVSWALAIGSVVVSVMLTSIFAPDLVTGANQEHLPLAAITGWVWGAVAVGYLSFIGRDRTDPAVGWAVAALWLAVAATSIAAPELVTGTDPTSIPIAALLAPVVGTVVTGFLALHAVRRGDGG